MGKTDSQKISYKKWSQKNTKKVSQLHRNWRNQFPHKNKLNSLKSRAKQRNHVWAISKEMGWALISSPCAYCGQIQENFNGLDRVDSNKGYTMNNVVPCCTYCNRAKSDMSVKEFENHINKIYNYREI